MVWWCFHHNHSTEHRIVRIVIVVLTLFASYFNLFRLFRPCRCVRLMIGGVLLVLDGSPAPRGSVSRECRTPFLFRLLAAQGGFRTANEKRKARGKCLERLKIFIRGLIRFEWETLLYNHSITFMMEHTHTASTHTHHGVPVCDKHLLRLSCARLLRWLVVESLVPLIK